MTEIETKLTLETWDLGQYKTPRGSTRSLNVCSWGRTIRCSSRGWGPVGWVAALLWRTQESTMDARIFVNTVLNTNHKLGTPWRTPETLYLVLGPPLQEDCWEMGKEPATNCQDSLRSNTHGPRVLRELGWFSMVNRKTMADLIAAYSYRKDTYKDEGAKSFLVVDDAKQQQHYSFKSSDAALEKTTKRSWGISILSDFQSSTTQRHSWTYPTLVTALLLQGGGQHRWSPEVPFHQHSISELLNRLFLFSSIPKQNKTTFLSPEATLYSHVIQNIFNNLHFSTS